MWWYVWGLGVCVLVCACVCVGVCVCVCVSACVSVLSVRVCVRVRLSERALIQVDANKRFRACLRTHTILCVPVSVRAWGKGSQLWGSHEACK